MREIGYFLSRGISVDIHAACIVIILPAMTFNFNSFFYRMRSVVLLSVTSFDGGADGIWFELFGNRARFLNNDEHNNHSPTHSSHFYLNLLPVTNISY